MCEETMNRSRTEVSRSPRPTAATRGAHRATALAVFLPAIVFASAAFAGPSTPPETDSIATFVSIAPQAYLVERIGGSHVSVQVLVGPGQSPHTFEPTPRQMIALVESRIYFAVGLPFESRLLARIQDLSSDIVIADSSRGIRKRSIAGVNAHHDDEYPVSDDGLPDPHVWLSPRLVKTMVSNISEDLAALEPGRAALFRANADSLLRDLDRLDSKLRHALAPLAGRSLFVFHPAFGYFADAYDLVQVAVEDSGQEPSARELARLVEAARAAEARVVFVQPQFSSRTAEAVAREIGGVVVPIDPLARNCLEGLAKMAEDVRAALTGTGELPAEDAP
jgi:zinc transport system substrate-binding protein